MASFVNVDLEIIGDDVIVTCWKTGAKWYYRRGLAHNENGPAYHPGTSIPGTSDLPEFALNGEYLPYEEWFRRINSDQIQP